MVLWAPGPHVHPAQTVVVQQVTKDGFDGALPDPPHALPPPTLLALPRPVVRGIVVGAGELLALGPGHAGGLQRALLVILTGGPIAFAPIAVGRGVGFTKRQDLARRAGVGVAQELEQKVSVRET